MSRNLKREMTVIGYENTSLRVFFESYQPRKTDMLSNLDRYSEPGKIFGAIFGFEAPKTIPVYEQRRVVWIPKHQCYFNGLVAWYPRSKRMAILDERYWKLFDDKGIEWNGGLDDGTEHISKYAHLELDNLLDAARETIFYRMYDEDFCAKYF